VSDLSELDTVQNDPRARIVLGFDPMGRLLAETVTDVLAEHGYAVDLVDGSGTDDYPDVAVDACRRVLDCDRHSAILVCGTGLGMSITANKVPGIRAARCTDTYTVEKARRNSDANVMALGAEVTTPAMAAKLVATWVEFHFDSERSKAKLRKIARFEATGTLDA
jgi:ribose 5-phosphate isomerase B